MEKVIGEASQLEDLRSNPTDRGRRKKELRFQQTDTAPTQGAPARTKRTLLKSPENNQKQGQTIRKRGNQLPNTEDGTAEEQQQTTRSSAAKQNRWYNGEACCWTCRNRKVARKRKKGYGCYCERPKEDRVTKLQTGVSFCELNKIKGVRKVEQKNSSKKRAKNINTEFHGQKRVLKERGPPVN